MLDSPMISVTSSRCSSSSVMGSELFSSSFAQYKLNIYHFHAREFVLTKLLAQEIWEQDCSIRWGGRILVEDMISEGELLLLEQGLLLVLGHEFTLGKIDMKLPPWTPSWRRVPPIACWSTWCAGRVCFFAQACPAPWWATSPRGCWSARDPTHERSIAGVGWCWSGSGVSIVVRAAHECWVWCWWGSC